jgi:peptidoglycan/LPS O-acetylase OafA/YrhL
LTAITLLLFSIGVVMMHYDAKAAFYFPFLRFWELAIGGIIAYLNMHKMAKPYYVSRITENKYFAHILSVVGAVVILVISFSITEE